ncbi:TOMM precursor leader peptide-binding protein [Psychromonas ossibalaenae]|uniref:TOMM precursor leader peptide-binding protein n=1 Tax=Psychromonas ossibalaenae TaxID=444922 RepID=UPI00037ADE32|nr:TOMM precursor leader peptide-binding protein [Psychromonas ossibalaenae]
MIIFEQYYEWHPKYSISSLYNNYVRVLADFNHNILNISSVTALNEILINAKTLDELSRKFPVNIILQLHQQLQALLSAGYIRVRDNSTDDVTYQLPDFSQKALQIINKHQSHEITVLSQCNSLEPLFNVFNQLDITNKCNVVIVDDYLDPRLETINQKYQDSKQDWVLIKVTGDQTFVGPLFSTENQTACWQCLNHRMRINNALRWIEYNNDSDSLIEDVPLETSDMATKPVPIKYDAELINKHITLLIPKLQQLLVDELQNCFFEINTERAHQESHPVIKRPQCPCCGDQDLYKKQTRLPVKFQQAKKMFNIDGGVRCVAPEETCALLKTVISPISGLLSHFNTVSKTGENLNQIYRSGFFQVPRLINTFTHKLSNATFLYTSMGKGIAAEQSQASALSEGIERLASQYQGDEVVFSLIPPENNPDYILPQQLSPFTDKQYKKFATEQNAEYQLYAAEKYNANTPLNWTPVWSLTRNKQCFVPLSYCYAHTPFEDHKFSRFYHNGGAAGNTLEEAVLQGFLEIVERDAIAVWWYNKLQKPSVDYSNMSDALLSQLAHTLGDDWQYWAIDLTTDFNIPVIAAVSQHKLEGKVCFGFGCHLNPFIACQRAFTELCQITEIRNSNTAPFDFDLIKQDNYLAASSKPPVKLEEYAVEANDDILDDINLCIKRASQLGLETLVLDYTRPDMILNTAKVIIPGTCHLFPYFAAERLYNVPVKMGWLEKANSESDLNQQALLI